MTISQIAAAFKRLSAENQLMLLDHLGELTDFSDEITEGLREAAVTYGRAYSATDDEAEAIADGIIPELSATDLKGWKHYAEWRDRTLAHALTSDKWGVSDVTRASA